MANWYLLSANIVWVLSSVYIVVNPDTLQGGVPNKTQDLLAYLRTKESLYNKRLKSSNYKKNRCS